MSPQRRRNDVTMNTVYRVYPLGEGLRQAVTARRRATAQTVRT